jgi:serine/threonine protein kinase
MADPANSPPTTPQPPDRPAPATVALPAGKDQAPLDQAATLPTSPTPSAAASSGVVVTGSFGDYELLGEIERGGMGIVYRARERHSGLLVALKMMLSESASGSGDLRRFILEARATGELNHPGVVAIHAWGEHEGHAFYTMDFVPGETLTRLLEKGRFSVERAVRYLLGIARAVGAAHALGIVHRDLKPSNVIIDLGDQPRVLDFGLAKRQRPASDAGDVREAIPDVLPADAPESRSAAPAAARLTEKGAILGTPSYMAPEQVRAEHEQVGPAADVHALGAIFYEMLTGRPPFQGQGTYETLMQVLDKEPAPIRAQVPHVPVVLEELCRHCLEKKSWKRYPNANALADDLERRWHRAVRGARFARLAVAAGAVLLVLASLRFVLHAVAPNGLVELARAAGDLAQATEPVRTTADVLAQLLEVVTLVLAPYLAEVGLIVWLVGWVRSGEHPWRIAGACAAAALVAGIFSLWDDLESLREPPLFLAGMLVVNALVVAGVCLHRAWTAAERVEAERAVAPAEPYLQRLFGLRSGAGGRTRAGRQTGLSAGPADFELGRTLFRWDDHEVRWARQQSLDRPALVWSIPNGSREPGVGGRQSAQKPENVRHAHDAVPSTPAPTPGVVVRHPCVLGLHAVGSGPEGGFLVTEPVAASPLAEVVQQRGLVPQEAAALTARIARAVQAFHDQGACHGRLSPEWILARGDLEPVLCPCGFPSQSPEARLRDVQALGRILQDWLPGQPRGWSRIVLAPLYRVARAAVEGAYTRPADLATDLERAARHVRRRWHEQLANVAVLLLLAGAIVFSFIARTWGLPRAGVGQEPASAAASDYSFFGYLLLAVAPATVLLGGIHGRALLRWVAERGRPLGGRAGLGGRAATRVTLALLLAGVVGVADWANLPDAAVGGVAGTLLLGAGEFAGFWFLGAALALMAAYVELLFRSLRPSPGLNQET